MLDQAWLIPTIPALSFVAILFFGKRLPRKGSEIGILAVGSSFVLACVTAVQWIHKLDTSFQPVDSIALADLRVSRPRRPGSRVTVTVKTSWGDGEPIVVGAIPSCRIAVRGSIVQAISTLQAGATTCSFMLPAGSARASVTGTLSVAATGVPPASASFRFSVTRA